MFDPNDVAGLPAVFDALLALPWWLSVLVPALVVIGIPLVVRKLVVRGPLYLGSQPPSKLYGYPIAVAILSTFVFCLQVYVPKLSHPRWWQSGHWHLIAGLIGLLATLIVTTYQVTTMYRSQRAHYVHRPANFASPQKVAWYVLNPVMIYLVLTLGAPTFGSPTVPWYLKTLMVVLLAIGMLTLFGNKDVQGNIVIDHVYPAQLFGRPFGTRPIVSVPARHHDDLDEPVVQPRRDSGVRYPAATYGGSDPRVADRDRPADAPYTATPLDNRPRYTAPAPPVTPPRRQYDDIGGTGQGQGRHDRNPRDRRGGADRPARSGRQYDDI